MIGVRKSTFFLLAIFAFGLVGFAPAAMAQAEQDLHMKVSVVEADGKYKLEFDHKQCPQGIGKRKGCMYYAKGRRGVITWRLDQAAKADGWKFARLRFSRDGIEWGEEGRELLKCVMKDFGLSRQELKTGWVTSMKYSSDRTKMGLRNNNECEQEYEVHYRVWAVRPDGERADSDPIIRNGGRN